MVADHVDNELLPAVYSSAGVVLNDHWGPMKAWGFVSNRLFDVLACGTPVISDAVDGIAELFEGAVPEYHDPAELRALVDEVLADPAAARARRPAAASSCWPPHHGPPRPPAGRGAPAALKAQRGCTPRAHRSSTG